MSDELNPPAGKVRSWLAAEIAPLLPDEWRIVPGISTVKTLLVPAVYFEFTELEKVTGLPVGHARAVLDLIVVDPRTDLVAGEDQVDDHLVDLVLTLDGHEQINWTGARKESIAEQFFGWRVALTVLTSISKE